MEGGRERCVDRGSGRGAPDAIEPQLSVASSRRGRGRGERCIRMSYSAFDWVHEACPLFSPSIRVGRILHLLREKSSIWPRVTSSPHSENATPTNADFTDGMLPMRDIFDVQSVPTPSRDVVIDREIGLSENAMGEKCCCGSRTIGGRRSDKFADIDRRTEGAREGPANGATRGVQSKYSHEQE